MTLRTRSTTFIALIICVALPAWGEQYLLYTPQPAPSGQKTPQDGILVQEIEIKKGDTLYDLSRKFSGRGMYFPQILLFNSIKNPNLIYAGNSLKVPVSQKNVHDSDRTETKTRRASKKSKPSRDKKTSLKTEAHPAAEQSTVSSPVSTPSAELSLSDLKKAGTKKTGVKSHKKNAAVHAKKSRSECAQAKTTPSVKLPAAQKSVTGAAPKSETAAGQKLFESAVKAYQNGDCRTALELFDRYLADNSGSPLAADANLYKAECYLKLSAQ